MNSQPVTETTHQKRSWISQLLPKDSLIEAARLPLLRGVLIFALFPLAASTYFSDYIGIQKAAWVVGIYFAVMWAYVIRTLIQLDNIKKRNLTIPSVFTPIVGIPLVLFLQNFPIIKQLYDATEIQLEPLRFLGFVGGVGLLEETAKILPILWLTYQAKELKSPKETAFYAAISGLAFGIAEAASYSLLYAQENARFSQTTGTAGMGNYILWQFLRTITLPLLHASFSGIVGYYLGLGINKVKERRKWLLIGLGMGALVHGLYDFFSSSWLGILTAALSIWLFVGLARADSKSH